MDSNNNNILLILLLRSITIIHLLLILFVVLVPFFNDNFLLLLHIMIVPFILFHWLMNDNNCSLTLIEKSLRKKIYGSSDLTCFTCQLIEPVYDFNKNFDRMTKLLYLITILLIFISIYKIYCKFKKGEIETILDLFDCRFIENNLKKTMSNHINVFWKKKYNNEQNSIIIL